MRSVLRSFVVAGACTALVLGIAVALAAPAQAGSTVVGNVRWTKSSLDVANRDKRSTLKLSISDSEGVCDAAVGISGPRGAYFTRTLYLDSGSNVRGTFATSDKWYLSERGRWRVTVVVVIDCDGRRFVVRDRSGIGSGLTVRSSKPVTKATLTGVPSALVRGSTDSASVRLRARGKPVRRATVRLVACRDTDYTGCDVVGRGRTGGSGTATVRYSMPRRDVVLYAWFRGNKSATRAASADREVEVRWATVRVGMSLSVSPTTTTDNWGSATATVRFDRPVCDADVTLAGDVVDWEIVYGCTRSVTFDLAEYNASEQPVAHSFRAELSYDGYGLEDSLTGRSNTVTLTVPGWDPWD